MRFAASLRGGCVASPSLAGVLILALLTQSPETWAGEPEVRPGVTIPFVAVSAGVGAAVGCSFATANTCYLGTMIGATAGVPLSMTYAHLFGDLRTQPWLMTLVGSLVGATPLLFFLEPHVAVLSMIAPVTTAIAASAAPMLIDEAAPNVSGAPAAGVTVIPVPGGAIATLAGTF